MKASGLLAICGVALFVRSVCGATVVADETADVSGFLPELTLNAAYTVGRGVSLRQNPQAAAPTKVTVNGGGSLRLTDISSRLVAPLDLDIAAGGKVCFPRGDNGVYARSTLVAHRLTVNGAEMPKGRHQADSGTDGWFEAYPGSSIVVPYVWTGAGDGTNWSNAANWEGDAVPPNDDMTAVDLSRAAGGTVVVNDGIRLTCIAFMPSGARRTLTVCGAGSLVLNAPVGLNGALVIAEGCELALDVDLMRGVDPHVWLSMIGGGRLTVRRGFPSVANYYGTVYPPFAFDGTLAFEGPDAAVRIWNPTTFPYDVFSVSTMESEGCSRVVIGKDCALDVPRLFASCPGFHALDEFVQEGGSVDLTRDPEVRDLYLVNHCNSTRRLTYELKGGSFTGSVRLGSLYSSSWERFRGGSFRMTGGTLTASALTSERNQNFFEFEGGRLRLGDGGIEQTSDPTGRWFEGNGGRTDFHLGGMTFDVIATATVACPLSVTLTGLGGETVFDCSNGAGTGGDLTFGAEVTGPGSFVKRGANTLTFASACSFTGGVTVEAGKVTFAAASTLSGVSRLVVTGGSAEILSAPENVTARPSLISLADASSLVLGACVSLTAGRLVVGGVARTGTVAFGGGTVTVEPPEAIAWKGADGAAWSVGSNWEGGSVPGADATADLSSADGRTILVDTAALRVRKLLCNATGTVTLRATGGGSFAFPDDGTGTAEVGEGARLVVDVPTTVPGGAYFRKSGRGTLVFAGGLAGRGATAYCTAVQGKVEVRCAATDVRFFCESQERGQDLGTIVIGPEADLSARSSAGGAWTTACGDVVQDGGTVDLTTPPAVWPTFGAFPFCYAGDGPSTCTSTYTLNGGVLKVPGLRTECFLMESAGDFTFVQNGGLASFHLFAMDGRHVRYELNGGTLQLEKGFSAVSGTCSAALNGGTLELLDTQTVFPSGIPVTLGGAVTIKTAAETTATVACDLAGEGMLTVVGPGTLKTAVPLTGVRNLVVRGGTLDLGGEVAATNLALEAGAKLNLGFSGTQTVKRLLVNGRARTAGVYGVAVGKTLGGRLSGEGSLRVLEGDEHGLYILVR